MIPAFPVLTTKRLQLREITNNDAAAILMMQSDPLTMRWYGGDPLTELAQAQAKVNHFAGIRQKGTGLRWGIELDGRLIGSCGFFNRHISWHNCLIGYEMARDCWGQGYMEEAVKMIIAYAFGPMQMHRLCAEIHADNAGSIKLATRLGFRLEGVHLEVACWSGRWHDLNCYSLLEQDW
jgi:ribosomal-protein-alanine N-acetyltransferase